MSIDWNKVTTKPDKEYKVPGSLLLDFKGKIALEEQRMAELQAKLDATTADKHTLDGRRKELEAITTTMETKISSMETTIRERDSEISALKGKIDGMQSAMGTSMHEKDAQVQRINDEKNAQVQRLNDEKNALKSSLETRIETLSSEKSTMHGEIDALKHRVKDLEASMARLESEKKGLLTEKLELEGNLKIMDDQLASRDFNYFKKLIKDRADRAAASFERKDA